MDAALEALHTRMYAGFGGGRHIRYMSEFLEHLASDNGAEMHHHNTLYTHKLNEDIPALRYDYVIFCHMGCIRYINRYCRVVFEYDKEVMLCTAVYDGGCRNTGACTWCVRM